MLGPAPCNTRIPPPVVFPLLPFGTTPQVEEFVAGPVAFHPRLDLSHLAQHVRNHAENVALSQRSRTCPQPPPLDRPAETRGFSRKAPRRKGTGSSATSYSPSNPARTRARSFARAGWPRKSKYRHLGCADRYLKRETGIKSPLETPRPHNICPKNRAP